MALQPIVFSNAIFDGINGFMAIDSSQYPVTKSDGDVAYSFGDYPSIFADSYEAYSLTGVVLGAIHGSQSPSIIESFLRTFNTSITEFATALANYWATVLIIPGIPAHGGSSVISVTNDAASHVSDFEAAIIASYTQEYQLPVFQQFILNIENIALPTVTWYVTELVGIVPVTFTEKVF